MCSFFYVIIVYFIHPMKHEPDNYLCPFCDWLAGRETLSKRNDDMVYQDDFVTAFISPKWWPNNPGNIIIIPNSHAENIYTINDDLLAHAYIITKKLSIAMRVAYECTGTSIRQHNEPDGNQSVWHFHIHLLPRYPNDRLYENHQNSYFAEPIERKKYARRIKHQLASTL